MKNRSELREIIMKIIYQVNILEEANLEYDLNELIKEQKLDEDAKESYYIIEDALVTKKRTKKRKHMEVPLTQGGTYLFNIYKKDLPRL